MCLYYSETETKNLRNKLIASRRSGRFYKVYAKGSTCYETKEGYLFSPYRNTESPIAISPEGVVSSNRMYLNLSDVERFDKEIHYGIHVFRSIKAIEQYFGRSIKKIAYPNSLYTVLEVLGAEKDLVGASEKEAVFMKIRITSKHLINKRVKKCINQAKFKVA